MRDNYGQIAMLGIAVRNFKLHLHMMQMQNIKFGDSANICLGATLMTVTHSHTHIHRPTAQSENQIFKFDFRTD